MTRRENSVLTALSELQKMEDARIANETAVRAERAAMKRAREEASKRAAADAQAHAERVAHAEAEARVRVELDVDRQLGEQAAAADARLVALRAELERVRAERLAIHERAVAGAMEIPEPTRSHASTFIAMGASAIAVGFAVLFFARPPAVEIRERVVEVPVLQTAARAPAPVHAPPAEVEEPAAVEEIATATAQPARPVRANRSRARQRRAKQRNNMRDRHDQVLGNLDRCGDDPLCTGE